MKQSKRKKTMQSGDALTGAAPSIELPDAAYVEQLLAGGVMADVEVRNTASEHEASHGTGTDNTGSVVLPAQCLLRDAVDYRQRLLACVASDSVCIDVTAVERIDTAFMQVLLAFVRSRAAELSDVTWLNPTAALNEAATLLGLHAALNLPVSAAA